ncbi:MAG: murein biosynthesis integral membrane protein MurJ [Phycisphaerales bacterium JB037]
MSDHAPGPRPDPDQPAPASAAPTPPARDSSAQLAAGVRTFGGLTLLSRVLGLARDLTTVRVFGDTALGSAFTAAFAIPNLFRRLFGEGALAAAFLPEYASLDRDDPRRRDAFATLAIVGLAIVTGAITILAEVALLAVLLLAPTDADRALSLRLIMVMLPFMPMVCIAAILGAMLQVHGRFGPSAAAPVLLNILMIAAASLHFFGPGLDPVSSAYAIGIAAVIAGIGQVAWCLRALRGLSRWTWAPGEVRDASRRLLRRFLPVVIGLGTIQLNALLDTIIAMWPNWFGPTIAGVDYPLDERSNAILGYTQRLYQFPLGVFGIAVATAAFPLLSRHASEPARFVRTLRDSLRLSLFIAIPAMVGLILVRDDLVGVVFGGGSPDRMGGFSDDGLARASSVLLGYSLGIVAYSVNHVLTRAFYARGDTRTPMKLALGAVALNLSLNLVLIWPMREAGLAWSTAISAAAQCVGAWWILRARLPAHADDDRPLLVAFAPALGALAAMTSLVLLTQWLVLPGDAAWSSRAIRLGICSLGGAGVYGAVAWRLGSSELRMLIGRGLPTGQAR